VLGRADTVFVTETAGEITGFNACMVCGGAAVIDLIGVAPGFQGRGLGRDLVNASRSHYAGRTSRMTVGTQTVNTASLALYLSCGFRIEASALTLHAHLS
jgi:ribosomal protein S18 acetylase RimI-like enzyme